MFKFIRSLCSEGSAKEELSSTKEIKSESKSTRKTNKKVLNNEGNFLKPITHTFQYGDHQVSLETSAIARQATAAVKISMGDTILLVTVVGKASDQDRGFFPLTVNYQERTYAAGKIPGGFFKREGRPSEREVLIARLIDRPIRPLFAKGFKHEVQVVVTLLSLDPAVETDIPAMIGVSAALSMSGLPFNGPISAARVGYQSGKYLLNPAPKDLLDSELDLVVSGTEDAVLMVESEAKELSEEVMLNAVMFGHEQMQCAIEAIKSFSSEAAKAAWEWTPTVLDADLVGKVTNLAEDKMVNAYAITEKLERKKAVDTVNAEVIALLCDDCEEGSAEDKAIVGNILHDIEAKIVRGRILSGASRIDGRDTKTVRPINVQTSILPRTHGSALFTRGETQAIVVSTLGTERDAQTLDSVHGAASDRFMLHYNFPPYCVGETGMMGSPKRREIGHGRLAKRALSAVLPNEEAFPYTLRLVSEITESNGSSSMASVCGGSLALMDAGVPIKAPVAGIAMGLIKEGEEFAVLTDILGDEDHLGDMDFKVAGTNDGVTALQMDIKIDGITRDIMSQALDQARDGRLHILAVMNEVLSEAKTDVSTHAPKVTTIKIHPDKIRDIIGKGGATIKELTESTNTSIDIDDEGIVKVWATNSDDADLAISKISDIVAEVEVGKVYEGPVTKIMDFGAFVNVLPKKDGLVHISQISDERVEQVTDVLKEGQIVKVKVLEIDRQGRVRLSMKAVDDEKT